MDSSEKTSSKKLVLDKIIDLVGRLIAENKLKSGDILPGERQLAKSLKISRSSVREALKILGVLGVLEIKHGTRTQLQNDMSKLLINPIRFMNLLNNIDLIDLYEDRKIIEVELVKLATKNATDADIQKMKKVLDDAKKYIIDPQNFLHKEFEFHDVILKASGNKTLTAMMSSINNLLIDVREKVVYLFEDLNIALNYHIKIFEAIKDRDIDKAGEMMFIHLEDAIRRIKKSGYLKKQARL
ncbi:MAG: FadR family transcriptional regulator [Actinobacteria bacterium]|nr:FadR family transcriptional regulator [Actinomycetota bacterium]